MWYLFDYAIIYKITEEEWPHAGYIYDGKENRTFLCEMV